MISATCAAFLRSSILMVKKPYLLAQPPFARRDLDAHVLEQAREIAERVCAAPDLVEARRVERAGLHLGRRRGHGRHAAQVDEQALVEPDLLRLSASSRAA